MVRQLLLGVVSGGDTGVSLLLRQQQAPVAGLALQQHIFALAQARTIEVGCLAAH